MSRWLFLAMDWSPAGGGIARLLESLAAELPSGIDYRVLTLTPGLSDDRVFRVTTLRDMALRLPGHVRWLRRGGEAQIVCAHVFLLPLALAARGARGLRVSALLYGREVMAPGGRHAVVRRLLPRAGRVVAISDYTADLARDCGVCSDRVRVVNPVIVPPWGIGMPPIRRPLDRGLRLVSVTRLTEGYKNLTLGLRAVAVLRDTGLVDRYTIVGDGALRPTLERFADDLGIRDIVRFTGQVTDDELAECITEADLGLFPSRDSSAERGAEGFGLVVQEMAFAGLPVLVGDAGGTPDASDPAWSVLLDPYDVRAWVHEIDRLARDEDARLRMAMSAFEWARELDPRATSRAFYEAIADANPVRESRG
ncbi:MAG: glycosyltransferase family 4 protein [Actinomycetota bacterium]